MGKHPSWLKVRAPAGENYLYVQNLLKDLRLNTVCGEAHCPNVGECFAEKTATFLILGKVCTRSCLFCAVTKGRVDSTLDPEEPERTAEAVKRMGLKYVVITSVTRDDLNDGGALVFARTIKMIRESNIGSRVRVEVLIPDLGGSYLALETILSAEPEVLGHNVETVPRLHPLVRPEAIYLRSLNLLRLTKVRSSEIKTKSGMLLGLGENWGEILETMRDIKDTGCNLLTLGQYLQPTHQNLPIQRYYSPEEFIELKAEGEKIGFEHVESGPLVRSSYHAASYSNSMGVSWEP